MVTAFLLAAASTVPAPLSSRPRRLPASVVQPYVKVGVGAGLASVTSDKIEFEYKVLAARLELSGPAVVTDAILGVSTSRRVILGAAYFGSVAPRARGRFVDNKFQQFTPTPTKGTLALHIVGPVLLGYLDPYRHLYARFGMGYSLIRYATSLDDRDWNSAYVYSVRGPRTQGGVGFVLGGGYDYGVAKHVAIGAGLSLALAPGWGEEYRPARASVVAATLTATYF